LPTKKAFSISNVRRANITFLLKAVMMAFCMGWTGQNDQLKSTIHHTNRTRAGRVMFKINSFPPNMFNIAGLGSLQFLRGRTAIDYSSIQKLYHRPLYIKAHVARSKYMPHQGKKERARRCKQMEAA
jgi:hypothetical protein